MAPPRQVQPVRLAQPKPSKAMLVDVEEFRRFANSLAVAGFFSHDKLVTETRLEDGTITRTTIRHPSRKVSFGSNGQTGTVDITMEATTDSCDLGIVGWVGTWTLEAKSVTPAMRTLVTLYPDKFHFILNDRERGLAYIANLADDRGLRLNPERTATWQDRFARAIERLDMLMSDGSQVLSDMTTLAAELRLDDMMSIVSDKPARSRLSAQY